VPSAPVTTSLVLGIAAAVYSLGSILDVSALGNVGLFPWIMLTVVLSLWIGIVFARRPLAAPIPVIVASGVARRRLWPSRCERNDTWLTGLCG
jgi:hypothetical protein